MKIYLATGNKNKKREIAQILPEHQIVIPADEGVVFDPIENGTTFVENSLIKARALWEHTHCPVIADDSGICVDALGGRPGIYSSRYAGANPVCFKPKDKIPQDVQNRLLIEELNWAVKNNNLPGLSDKLTYSSDAEKFSAEESFKSSKTYGGQLYKNGPRSAHYTCAIVFLLDWNRYISAEETMEGTIVNTIEEARGSGGFGYDPLFYLPQFGKTAAELTADEKNAISHRGKATRLIQAAAKFIFENKKEFL